MEDFSSANANKNTRPVAIVSLLLQNVVHMQHIDELFIWMADNMLQHFSAASVQIWATQAYTAGTSRIKLRASTSPRPFQALTVLESAEVSIYVKRILREQQSILSIPVTNIFSHYQATALAQQGCQYWTVYFIRQDLFLEVSQREPQKDEIPTPLRLAFSFFTPQPLQAGQARTISFLIEQALRIASNHGLLSTTSKKLKGTSQPASAYLIPGHIQYTEIKQVQKPFSNAIIISDRQSQQIYNLIDGKKNIVELASLLHMEQEDILETLQSLLEQGYIKLHEAGEDGHGKINGFSPHTQG